MNEYNVAWQLEGERRPDEAIPLLKAIIAKDKTFWRAYYTLVSAYSQKREMDEVQQYMRSLLAQDPTNGFAHYGLGWVFRLRLDLDAATAEFATCNRLAPEAHACYLAFLDTVPDRDLDASAQKIQKAIAAGTAHPSAYLGLAALYQRQWKLPEAMMAAHAGLENAQASHQPEVEAALHMVPAGNSIKASDGYGDALTHALKALEIYVQLEDWEGQFSATTTVGGSRGRLGDLVENLKTLQRVLELARQFRHRRWEALCLELLGSYWSYRGDLDQALGYYLEERRLYDAINEQAPGKVLVYIANNYRKRGRSEEALPYLLEVARDSPDGRGERGFASRDLGILYDEGGDFLNSLKYASQSVRLFQEQGMKAQAGAVLGNIASIYAELGDYESAKAYYEKSLRSAREGHNAGEQQRVLADLGGLYLRMNHLGDALSALRESLTLSERTKDPPLRASTLLGIAEAYARSRQYASSVKSVNEALQIAQTVHLIPIEAEALIQRADCYLHMSDLAAAERDLKESLALAKSRHLVEAVMKARTRLAGVNERQKDYLRSLENLELAIDSIENMRVRIPTPELRSAFVAKNSSVYEDAIRVLSFLHDRAPEQGYDRTTFAYAERGRARSFLDTLAEAKVQTTNGLNAEEASRQEGLFTRLSKASAVFLQEGSEKNLAALRQAEKYLTDWTIELRSTNPKYQELKYPEPFGIGQVQSILAGSGAAVLEYALGEQRSHLWIITEKQALMLRLPRRAEVENAVSAYRAAVALHPTGTEAFDSSRTRSTALYDMLVGPAHRFLTNKKKLIIVPDGILYYLPFETLARSGRQYLIEDFQIAYAPSATVYGDLLNTKNTGGSPRRRDLLVFADPLFSAPGDGKDAARQPLNELVRSIYERGGISFTPLPSTRVEARSIAELYPPPRRTIYLGRDATEAAVKREKLAEYRTLHFATHAIIDEEAPARTPVVLSLVNTGEEDGILRMAEIFNLKLDADLVVLSACQTGLGKLVKGEGVVGLTRAFMYAGTPRVVVSLWKVNDLATASFMRTFYLHMRDGQNPAAALRNAKLAMIHSDTPAYQHPYFWAPFVLVGLF